MPARTDDLAGETSQVQLLPAGDDDGVGVVTASATLSHSSQFACEARDW
jgi:hypothetical protein